MNERIKTIISQFINGTIGGMLIGIGGCVSLSCDNKYVGSLLFSLGLFTIIQFGFGLFTGKIGYAPLRRPAYLAECLFTLLGNTFGTFIDAFLLNRTRISAAISEKALGSVDTKLADSPLSAFILAVFCGILMFIAADGFKNIENPVGKMLVIFLPVMVFILSGFEHCVANMFYFTAGMAWSLKAFGYLLVMSVGNAIGGMFIPLIRKWFVE